MLKWFNKNQRDVCGRRALILKDKAFSFSGRNMFRRLTYYKMSLRVFLNFWVGLFLFKAMQEVSQVS